MREEDAFISFIVLVYVFHPVQACVALLSTVQEFLDLAMIFGWDSPIFCGMI